MTSPENPTAEDGLRLGLWVVALATMIALALGAPVLSFGMPVARLALWGMSLVLPLGAFWALKQRRTNLAMGILAPAAFVAHGPLLGFFSLVVRAASVQLFIWVAVADALLFGALWKVARNRGNGVLLAFPALLMLVHMIAAGGVLYQLYRLPGPGVCDALSEQSGVVRASKNHGPGLAHQALILGESDYVAGTFKVDRDMLLAGLGSGEGNAVAVFRNADMSVGAEPISPPVTLPEGEMPQFMLYDSKGRLAFTVTSVLDGHHKLGIINKPTASELKVNSWVDLPGGFEPNAILEDDGSYIVFALHAEVLRINPETLEIAEQWVRPDGDWLKGKVVLSVQADSEGKTFLSTLGFNVIEHNIRSKENRKLRIPWGGAGGVLRVLEGKGEFVVADMVFHNLIFIDQESLEIKRVMDLGFGPRAVAWDAGRELLYVGEYINGRVHAFRYSDLKPVGPSFDVGENLRSFTFDPKTSTLLASTKCGLIGVDVRQIEGK